MRYRMRWTEFFVILGHFLPFYPNSNPENYNNHMMYGSWATWFFKILGDFLPTNNWKNENLKKWKKATWRYHVKQVYQKSCYTVPEIWHVTDVIFIFYFGLSFYFTPLTTQKIKIKKKRKIEIQSFYLFVPKIKIKWCTFPEIFCAINGQMDRWRPHLKSTDKFFFSNNSSSATKKRLFKLFERKMPFR